MILRVRSAHLSLQGARPKNEDAVLEAKHPGGGHLVAVADGMGGHRSGEVASAMAVRALDHEMRAGASLHEGVRAANAAVLEEATRNLERAGMGTTLVALYRSGSGYQIANVGDSRAYRLDRTGIRQLSVDHSFAAEAARSGGMSPEEIARSPWRNALTRSLGTQADVEIDLFGPFEITGLPHAVMLCTDGVYRALSDEVLWEHLCGASTPDAAARSLAQLAARNGSDDNISLAIVEFGALFGQPDPAADEEAPRGPWRGIEPSSRPGILLVPERERLSTAGAATWPGARRRDARWLPGWPARLMSSDSLFHLCVVAIMLWLVLNFALR